MNPSIPKCGASHTVDWLVTYDIGKKQTEQIFVCRSCFENPSDDCFRLYVIAKHPRPAKESGQD